MALGFKFRISLRSKIPNKPPDASAISEMAEI